MIEDLKAMSDTWDAMRADNEKLRQELADQRSIAEHFKRQVEQLHATCRSVTAELGKQRADMILEGWVPPVDAQRAVERWGAVCEENRGLRAKLDEARARIAEPAPSAPGVESRDESWLVARGWLSPEVAAGARKKLDSAAGLLVDHMQRCSFTFPELALILIREALALLPQPSGAGAGSWTKEEIDAAKDKAAKLKGELGWDAPAEKGEKGEA